MIQTTSIHLAASSRPGLKVLNAPVLVSPDLHAYPRRLAILKERLKKARRRDPETHLVLLGDIIDRGSDAESTLAWVREQVEGGRATLLAGNHEAMGCIGALEGDSVALQLYNIWQRHGGREWVKQLGGMQTVRADLEWLRRHCVLAAEVVHGDTRTLLVHARVPDAAGWALIARAAQQAPGPHGEATLAGVQSSDVWVDEASATFLWGDPSGQQGNPASEPHVRALHGHMQQNNPRIFELQTQGPVYIPTTLLDLNNSSKLATALIADDGSVHVEV